MTIKTLDALVLACLDEEALVPRIAALWCRAFKDRAPISRIEIVLWVKREFGPIIDDHKRDRMALQLIEETKRQLRLRVRRRDYRRPVDPLLTPAGSDTRVGKLLQSRLGPAASWVRRQTLVRAADPDCHYISAGFFSGLVAGLIPIQMRLRRITNPYLLVYRRGFGQPRSYWVPNHITSVADAFIWVIPSEAHEFLELEGTRVEHDGDRQAVKLITVFGSKYLPWKCL